MPHSREATTGHPRRHDVVEETREIFNTFMALSEALENPSGLAKDPSIDLGLDFSTEIESDSVGPASSGSQESTSSSDSAANGDADSEKYKEVGIALQRIGDDVNEQFVKKNPKIQKDLQDLGKKFVKETAEKVFQETMEGILTEFTGSFPHQEEKYKVALVMLCTRSSVLAMNRALDVTKETRDAFVGTATEFIAGHFPGWIENFSS